LALAARVAQEHTPTALVAAKGVIQASAPALLQSVAAAGVLGTRLDPAALEVLVVALHTMFQPLE
jgi:hypothetical protein